MCKFFQLICKSFLSGILKTKYLWKIITLQECKIKFDYEYMVLWVCTVQCSLCSLCILGRPNVIWYLTTCAVWFNILWKQSFFWWLMYMIWKSKDILYILFGSFFQILPDMRFYNLLHSRDFCVQLQTETLLTSTYSEWLNIMGCILGWSHI